MLVMQVQSSLLSWVSFRNGRSLLAAERGACGALGQGAVPRCPGKADAAMGGWQCPGW